MRQPSPDPVAGLILAGGLSRRLGEPKQTLPFGNGTLLEHAVAQAEAVPDLDPVLVVLPPEGTISDPAVGRATIVHRVEGDGCSSSLHAGVKALPADVAAIAVLPADMPDLDSGLIALAVRSWCRTRPAALVLDYRGRIGHPFVLSSGLRDRLSALHGEKALWRLLEELGEAVERVRVDRDVPRDIDTLEDYRRTVVP